MSNWKPITEHEPQCGEVVWLFDGNTTWIGGRDMVDSEFWLWCHAYGNFWWENEAGKWKADLEADDDYHPTHWMPLPQPPTP